MNTQIFLWFNHFAGQSAILDHLIVFFAQYLPYILVVLWLVWAYRSTSQRWGRFFFPALAAVISRGVITTVIRWIYHHPRPFDAMTVYQLVPESGWSFPSGHMAFFFALSGVIYRYDKKWGTHFFAATTFMGIARVMAGVHYPVDILGGALLGLLVAWVTSLLFIEKSF